MANASTEQKELDLVEKVDFKILHVANDETKLNQLLKVYLPPLLLKGGSEHESVRNKVITIAKRLMTFIQSPGVVLPVAALLDQFKKTDSSVVGHLDMMFIHHSIGRLDPADRRDVIPAILRGIAKEMDIPTSSRLFNTLLRSLKDLKLPSRGSKEDEAFRQEIGLSDAKDAEFVAGWFGKLLLLRPMPTAGLSGSELTFLGQGKRETWDSSSSLGLSLPETRIRVVNFLVSGAFTDEERFLPAVYAAASTDYRVSTVGEDMLKRTTVSLEDETRVKALFKAHSRLSAPYRIKILNILSKSATSTGFTDDILNVVRRDIKGTSDPVDSTAPPATPASATGLELTKIHKALFEYINWVARIGPGKGEFEIGQAMIDLLRKYVEDQGWPKPERQSMDEITLRSRAYETIGVLGKGCSMEYPRRLALVSWLFRSLCEDPTPEVVVNIDGALSSLTSLFKPDEDHDVLRRIILTYMSISEGIGAVRSVRHAATKWANMCLKLSDPTARWVDILAIAGRRDERNEVVEEGHKGLDPWTYRVNDDSVTGLPDWKDMTQKFFKEVMMIAGPELWRRNSTSVFTNFDDDDDKLRAFPVALTYCKRMLLLAALKDFKVEPGWERQLDTLVQSDKSSRETIRSYLRGVDSAALLDILTVAFEGILLQTMTITGSMIVTGSITEECARCFVELASLSPQAVLAPLASRALKLMPSIKSNKKEIRVLAARAFGILAPHPSNSQDSTKEAGELLSESSKPWRTAVGSQMNAVEGSYLAMAHLWSRSAYYTPDRVAAYTTEGSSEDGINELLPKNDFLSTAPASFQETIFDMYTQLWTASFMPGGSTDASISSIIDVLFPQCKKGNERAITALGRLAIATRRRATNKARTKDAESSDFVEMILSKLYELHEIKRVEVHFAVGEAITAAIAGWDSDVVQLTLDVDSDATWFRVGRNSKKLTEVLNKILNDCKSTKPSLLKASGIWLFCIIQHCSHLRAIQKRLRECQVAFMRLLSARDELVQETASRGLSLVYEKGDPALKEDLVKDLVGAFTGSGTQLKVEEETELFEAGALPTGEGKSVTSYKDIVNLANEVGDQSLVYKFMSLASNAATWSTRSAFGRFGLSNILSESEVDPKLYPKLFRYRFDPNSNVQRSMNDIWKALVKDSNAVIETHFDAIMTDLLKNILTKEWRVRQASCAAIADLVGGRPFQQYEKYYQDVWTKALKVLDDVKSSVREAALKLCMGLSKTLTRQLEESGVSSSAKAMMNEALPFLLSDKGIESGVEDVKVFATITVLDISKNGGQALRPFIALMVNHLLGLLSTIESGVVDYHYQRSSENDREKIDKARGQFVSRSPIYEAIENCLRNVDGSVMPDLMSGLEGTIKSAIGMPTKIGCSNVLSTLATRHTTEFAPYSAKFLKLMEKQALDRNDVVSQNYAKAASYIMRFASDEAKEHFIEKYISLYFSADNDGRRQKVADVVLALSTISPDHFAALESSLLPFSYFGKHDTDDYVKKAFDKVWNQHAGSIGTVSRYVPEIVALVERSLDTAQWSLKHTGAFTTASAVIAVTGASDLTGAVNIPNLKALWPVFDKALVLKTFEGKEKLLEALPDFVAKGKEFWANDATIAAQLRKIAVREAKRNNDAYRVHAYKCLGKVAAARTDLDMLDEIVEIVSPYLDELKDEDRMDVDKKDGKEDLTHKTAANGLEAIAVGYSRPKMKADPVGVLSKVLDTLKPYLGSTQFGAIRREAWYKCVADLMDDAATFESAARKENSGGEVAVNYFETLDVDKPDVGTEAQRSLRAKAAIALCKALKKGVFASGTGEATTKIKEGISQGLVGERSLDVQRLLRDALAEF